MDDALFYCSVREYVIDEIVVGAYRENVAERLAKVLSLVSMTIVTMWVMIQGYNLISGQSKQAALPLLYKTGKIVLILSLVSLLAGNSPAIIDSVEGFKEAISHAVTKDSSNDSSVDVTMLIDINLGITAMISSINQGIRAAESGQNPNLVTSTVGLLGQAGPAMLTATLLLLTELSVTLAIMLAPVFIFFLIFQQTAPLFWSWAKFLLGALFSLATLTLVATIALKTTALYGLAVVATYYLSGTEGGSAIISLLLGMDGEAFDMNASSLRLAALGTLMTAIIISVPPVIMGFFGGAAAFTTGAMYTMAGAGLLAGQLQADNKGGGQNAAAGMSAVDNAIRASANKGLGTSTSNALSTTGYRQSLKDTGEDSAVYATKEVGSTSADEIFRQVSRGSVGNDVTYAGSRQSGMVPLAGGQVGLARADNAEPYDSSLDAQQAQIWRESNQGEWRSISPSSMDALDNATTLDLRQSGVALVREQMALARGDNVGGGDDSSNMEAIRNWSQARQVVSRADSLLQGQSLVQKETAGGTGYYSAVSMSSSMPTTQFYDPRRAGNQAVDSGYHTDNLSKHGGKT
ncbi:MAG: type IV secretion system protein [Ottowia sp.]